MLENILAFLFPPSFGGPVVHQDFEDNIDPFSDLNGMDGVVAVYPKKYRNGIERVQSEGF